MLPDETNCQMECGFIDVFGTIDNSEIYQASSQEVEGATLTIYRDFGTERRHAVKMECDYFEGSMLTYTTPTFYINVLCNSAVSDLALAASYSTSQSYTSKYSCNFEITSSYF